MIALAPTRATLRRDLRDMAAVSTLDANAARWRARSSARRSDVTLERQLEAFHRAEAVRWGQRAETLGPDTREDVDELAERARLADCLKCGVAPEDACAIPDAATCPKAIAGWSRAVGVM